MKPTSSRRGSSPTRRSSPGSGSIAVQTIADATSGPLAGFVRSHRTRGRRRGSRPARDAVDVSRLRRPLPGVAQAAADARGSRQSSAGRLGRTRASWSNGSGRTDTTTAFVDGDADLARAVLTERLLHLRRRRPAAFGEGAGYVEVEVTGPGAEHVVAYARTDGETPLVVVDRRSSAPTGCGRRRCRDRPSGGHVAQPHRSTTRRSKTVVRRRLTDLLDRPVGGDGVPRFEVLDRTDR